MRELIFSRDAASLVQNAANIALLLSLVVGVISTFLVIWTGNIKESYLKRDIGSANAVAETAKKDAAIANEHAALLKKEAEVAKLEQERLKKELAWRTVTKKQIEIIRSNIPEPHPRLKIWLQYSEADPEALAYAQQIGNAINSSNFEIQTTGFITWGGATGLSISPNEGSEYLFKAFNAAGIKAVIAEEYPNGSASGQIVVRVGSKSRPAFKVQ